MPTTKSSADEVLMTILDMERVVGPPIREMLPRLGLSSTSAVFRYIRILEAEGLVTKVPAGVYNRYTLTETGRERARSLKS